MPKIKGWNQEITKYTGYWNYIWSRDIKNHKVIAALIHRNWRDFNWVVNIYKIHKTTNRVTYYHYKNYRTREEARKVIMNFLKKKFV